jgi:hypothetical protein
MSGDKVERHDRINDRRGKQRGVRFAAHAYRPSASSKDITMFGKEHEEVLHRLLSCGLSHLYVFLA